MATSNRMRSLPLPLLVLSLLLLFPSPSSSISFSDLQSICSLSHSLLTRVSNLRASRGDALGAQRAEYLASKLEQSSGFGIWRLTWNLGWDYVRNYAWREFSYTEMLGVMGDLNGLLTELAEFARLESDSEKSAWVKRHYQAVLARVKSLFQKLLKVFYRSGAMREVVKTVQMEVLEGGLLRDCMELGSTDLYGLIRVLGDLLSQSSYSHSDDADEL